MRQQESEIPWLLKEYRKKRVFRSKNDPRRAGRFLLSGGLKRNAVKPLKSFAADRIEYLLIAGLKRIGGFRALL